MSYTPLRLIACYIQTFVCFLCSFHVQNCLFCSSVNNHNKNMSEISVMQSGRIVWLNSLTKLFLFSLRAFQRGPPPAKPLNDRRSDRNSRRIIRENARAVLLRRVIVTYDRIPVKADWIIPPRRGESSSSRRLQPTWRYAKFGSDPRNCFLRIHRSIDRSIDDEAGESARYPLPKEETSVACL